LRFFSKVAKTILLSTTLNAKIRLLAGARAPKMANPIWIPIPAGPFVMGSDPRDAAPPFDNERPLHRVTLAEFRISRVPITNAQYRHFIAATAHPAPAHWHNGEPPAGQSDFPVTYVTWHDAQAFCHWAGVRLPSEAEWEKAARGPATQDTRTIEAERWWPWGNTLPTAQHSHFDGQAQGIAPAGQSVMPVGAFPLGASPYGVLDMAGNVWEWTHSLYHTYPYRAADGREKSDANGPRVVRGGSYNHSLRHIRCAARDGMASGVRDLYISFRVATADTPARLDFDWVAIPAGPFWMGSAPRTRHAAVLPSEMPQHIVELAGFHMAQTPVTNAEYHHFVQTTGHPPPAHWYTGDIPPGLERHPVTHVDWHDAQSYCRWAGVRLPNEAEWERAAAGPVMRTGARIYPWGNARPTRTRLNFQQSGKHTTTTPVDAFPRGATPEGILDMAGNVWEWTNSRYAPYPYSARDSREETQTSGQRVLRGGSYLSPSAAYVRCAMRSLSYETRRREHIGFRVAR
jgi:formylglycine-generating enzyme required for sulfatase activity